MTGQQHPSSLRQAEIIMALSLATDLGTGRPMEWAMRSALLGVRLGAELGLNDQELREVYYCALLLYIGCTSEIGVALQLLGDDPGTALASFDFVDQGNPQAVMTWMLDHIGAGQPADERQNTLQNAGTLIAQYKTGHCEVAQLLAKRLRLEEPILRALWHLGEKWNGEGVPQGLKGEAIALPMRIVLLVRDLEPYLNTHGVEAAVNVARQRGGVIHDPHVASRFCEQAYALCATLEQDADWDSVLAVEPLPRFYGDDEFDDALTVMADFIDLISPFFTCHSRNVAALVETAALEYGLPASDIKAVWRAALVHDIGKVAVPHGLWNRPRSLSSSEWERVRLHPYYSERILARPKILAQLGSIAMLHHERLDGSGYHRYLRGEAQSLAARLLAAANFYQARVEQRPNRPVLAPEEAAQAAKQEARAGRLDSDAVNAVLKAAGHHTTPIRRERVAGLSERELDVLRLIAGGLSNRQMAQHLTISEKTISTHIMHIYEKIGCSTRSAATLFAMQHSLIYDLNP